MFSNESKASEEPAESSDGETAVAAATKQSDKTAADSATAVAAAAAATSLKIKSFSDLKATQESNKNKVAAEAAHWTKVEGQPVVEPGMDSQ
jgi:hypothetical protein